MRKSILGLLLISSPCFAQGTNSAIYEEAILPSFAETEYYQNPNFSVDFELDLMMDSTRFGAELKFAQQIGAFFSVVESATYYKSDTAEVDLDQQYILGAGALFTPFKSRLISPFIQIDAGYLGWVEENPSWTGSTFAGHRLGLKVNMTPHFGLLVQKRDIYMSQKSPIFLHRKIVEGKKVSINDVSFIYHISI